MTDTPTADDLRVEAIDRRLERIATEVQRLHGEAADLRSERDDLVRRNRPTYPTDAQREGIATACRWFREGGEAKSHHGDPCGPEGARYVVVADPIDRPVPPHLPDTTGTRGQWLNVRSLGSAYERPLWRFGASDVEALTTLLADEGFTVVSHWPADGSHSFIVVPA